MQQRYSRLNLFSAEGRVDRLTYFFYSFILPVMILWVFASLAGLANKLGSFGEMLAYGLLGLGIIASITVLIRLTIQRSHDFNLNGWLSLLILVIPPSVLLFWLTPGTNGLNSYGEPAAPTHFLKWVTPPLFGLFLLITAYVAIKMDIIQIPNGVTNLSWLFYLPLLS
jgi:uncharacterized membrane protein YhaH (DUF805 family)